MQHWDVVLLMTEYVYADLVLAQSNFPEIDFANVMLF